MSFLLYKSEQALLVGMREQELEASLALFKRIEEVIAAEFLCREAIDWLLNPREGERLSLPKPGHPG